MRLLVLALLVAGAAAHAGHGHHHHHHDDPAQDPSAKAPGVVDITPDNYASVINGAKSVLVEVYAPWCGHCKQLAPTFKELGAAVEADKELSSRVVVAKIDGDAHPELGEKMGTRGFPTLKFVPRGKLAEGAEDYQGGRTKDDLLTYIKEKAAAVADAVKIDALAPIHKKFLAAKKAADLPALVDEARAAVEALAADDGYAAKKEAAEAHVAALAKAAEKKLVGEKYFKAERERLERVVASGSVSAAKLQGMVLRSDVLGAILEAK